jgi:formate dehydrogenase subunit delta
MTTDHLVHMANQIALAFKPLPEADAIASTEDHIRKFWDPRMRRKILAHLSAGGQGLDPIVRAALTRLSGEGGPSPAARN